MEAVYYAARANLRRLMLLHPTWTRGQLAQATGPRGAQRNSSKQAGKQKARPLDLSGRRDERDERDKKGKRAKNHRS